MDDGIGQIQALLARIDKHPLPGWGDRPLTESLALTAILYSLYSAPGSWEDLRNLLTAALAGDGGPMLNTADAWLERNPTGTGYSTNYNEAMLGVVCLDTPAAGGVEHARSSAEAWSRTAPVFGRYNAWSTLPCWQWPAADGVRPLSASLISAGRTPVLLVSTTHDPATPYAWGVQVASEMPGATLLTYDGDGHTAYRRGSTCIDAAIDAYLLQGTLPPAGTTCTHD